MSSCLGASKYVDEEGRSTILLENGAILLKELIASCNGKYNPIRCFTAKELQIATNNYDDSREVQTNEIDYKIYNGFSKDRPISVLKFEVHKYLSKQQARRYGINNIKFASQMCHKNFLKLIGCCLETQIPILVFESPGFETLANRIHGHPQAHFGPFLWTHRLKIATEIANALTYLHIAFARPIVFRNVRPSNILLHEQYVPKLFDFSLSESIPEGETHIVDVDVKGTSGYIAPEHIKGSAFNQKLDVYSFGALLLELLTGQKIYYSTKTDDKLISLEYEVKKNIEKNKFNEIIDPAIIGNGICSEKEQQLKAFIELAFKCLSKSVEERPTMIDVAKQLRKMYQSASM